MAVLMCLVGVEMWLNFKELEPNIQYGLVGFDMSVLRVSLTQEALLHDGV